MTSEPSCESRQEWVVTGTPESVKAILVQVAEDFRTEAYYFRAKERPGRTGLSFIEVRADAVQPGLGAGSIGAIHVDPLHAGRSRLLIRPDESQSRTIAPRLFLEYLSRARSELQRLGFLSTSSRFRSYEVLQTARRELDAAEDSTSFANIGNSCRGALIALGNELYEPYMLPTGQPEPEGPDAKTKLKHVCHHYFAGRGGNYRKGLVKVVEGVWDMASPMVHRHETATREEAEATLALVGAVFEAFSFIVPT